MPPRFVDASHPVDVVDGGNDQYTPGIGQPLVGGKPATGRQYESSNLEHVAQGHGVRRDDGALLNARIRNIRCIPAGEGTESWLLSIVRYILLRNFREMVDEILRRDAEARRVIRAE